MQKQSSQRIILAILIIVLLVAWAMDFHYYKTHGEKFIPSFIERLIHSPEDNQEPDYPELPVKKLTVNPNYDGTNKEFILDTSDDANAVTKIHQTIDYEYYDKTGKSIRIIKTQVMNAQNDVLFSGYTRSSYKMKDTAIFRQEIDITYRYDENTIHRNYTITSFTDEGDKITVYDQSDVNRT